MDYVFIYRLTSDTGLAPCVKDGLLSLACCKGGQIRNGKIIKTGLRYRIGVNRDNFDYNVDNVYLLGTYNNKLLYLARVTDILTMKEYYCGLSKGRTDDIYRVKTGHLERNNWLKNLDVHTEPGRIIRDLAGEYVVLSEDYIYLGKDAMHIDILDKYNARYQETKLYKGKDAIMIIAECRKYNDGINHEPNSPFKKNGGCK